jgi:glycerol-3-phosphate dehydrogenase
MNRDEMWARANFHPMPWDMVIIGGGATGVGVAIDAASRGYDVLLLEQHDFGKGTSSRSTKLAHGGVRYLGQGNIGLVKDALRERGLLLQNAPHIVREIPFIVPNYDWWEAPFYGLGLKLYQLLAGKYGLGTSRILSRDEMLRFLPTLKTEGLRSGTVYYDGQFDDARLLIHMVATAYEQGAVLLNYVEVIGLTKSDAGTINGVKARNMETGDEIHASAKVVINATGAFSDNVRRLVDPNASSMILPSQGIHLVLAGSFLASGSAIMVPSTRDGRVLFAIPWHNHTLVGTTDTPLDNATLEPVAREEEIDFLLATAGEYLATRPTREDVLSVFAGIRPLVRANSKSTTAALSRDHVVHVDQSGLISVMGGKWTTYRHMAEDCVDRAAVMGELQQRPCITPGLPIHGSAGDPQTRSTLSLYGSDAAKIRQLIRDDTKLGELLHPMLPYLRAEVVWAVRNELARTVEDVLARRTRALFLNARASVAIAPVVADIIAAELHWQQSVRDKHLSSFNDLAANYLLS